MKVISITAAGGPEVLQLDDRQIPTPAATEVLIKVHAAGVNRPDIAQRKGHYPAPKGAVADIPGLEVAGEITAIGSNVNHWKVGDPVCALLTGGGYAEFVTVDQKQVLPIPTGLDMVEAASLPETFFTVWSNVFDRGQFKAGEKVLIHGGTSGIGVTAIQMVQAMGGYAFASAGTPEKVTFCQSLGAQAYNYKSADFWEALQRDSEGIDIILDMVGGDYFEQNIKLLNPDGRLIFINAMKGRQATVDILQIMTRRLHITGSTLRARDADFKGEIATKLSQHIWPLLSAGTIKPIVYQTFPLADAAKAHQLMESSEHIGKIVLVVS